MRRLTFLVTTSFAPLELIETACACGLSFVPPASLGVISAVARFDDNSGAAEVQRFGRRLRTYPNWYRLRSNIRIPSFMFEPQGWRSEFSSTRIQESSSDE